MKVLKDNTNRNVQNEEPKALRVECYECGSELEVTKEDTYIGEYGIRFVKCPCCEKETPVDVFGEFVLTADTVEFPQHFAWTSKENGAKDVGNDKIKEFIQRGVTWFRKNKEEFAWYTKFGDLFLAVMRYEGDKEYEVIVTKNYYHTNIPFEQADYSEV